MARPKSADPDATRARILLAAREIAVEQGLLAITARPVAKVAGVSATTVCTLFRGLVGLRMKVAEEAFQPLLMSFEDRQPTSAFNVAVAPFQADRFLAPLVTQVAACAAIRSGENHQLARQIDVSWAIVREHLVRVEIPHSPLRDTPDSTLLADQIISLYFAAAFHLAREPKIGTQRLRALLEA